MHRETLSQKDQEMKIKNKNQNIPKCQSVLLGFLPKSKSSVVPMAAPVDKMGKGWALASQLCLPLVKGSPQIDQGLSNPRAPAALWTLPCIWENPAQTTLVL